MRIYISGIFVDNQQKALDFYTEILGFQKKHDIPMGEGEDAPRWLTLVSPSAPDGPELSLEPAGHRAVAPFRDALVSDGIPFTSFAVDDVRAEVERLRGLGVRITQEPTEAGTVVIATIDDTCGNLIQLLSGEGY
ncbi:MAG: VOC family protein [Acidobacteriota bacterium]